MAQPTRDIAVERAEIDALVAGKTVPSVFMEAVEQHPDQEALKWRGPDGWQTLTWAQYRDRVRDATMGLIGLGFSPREFGLIMARNRPEHLIADLAITHAGGSSVSIYNTLAPEQIAYIAGHCEGTVAFLEDRGFLDKFLAIRDQLPRLRRVVLMEGDPGETGGWVMTWQQFVEDGRRAAEAAPAAFDAAWARVQPGDVISLIYTSGTTGTPKGVMYSHYNILWTCESSQRNLGQINGDRLVSYLPLAHIAERFTSHWGGIYAGLITYLEPDTNQLLPALLEARPQLFVGVPRVWEKFQTALQLGLAAEKDEGRKAMVQQAIAAQRQLVELQQRGETPPPDLAATAERVAPVLAAIRSKIGLDQCRIAVTSTAPTPVDVLLFFASIGLPILEVWGMSELTGPATSDPPGAAKYGTVGPTIPGVEAKLDEDGELLIRGGNVMLGYYKEPAKTAEVLDAGGWLRTGDIATVDADGYYSIVDRKKELIITSGGKNISPSNIEALLKHHPLVSQAMAIGDRHNYITALIVLDQEVAPTWARAHGITSSSPAELAQNPAVVEEIRRAVAEANTHLAQVEQVKRFVILPTEWTAESEELTPTLKIKRRVILQKYAAEIEGMYADPPIGYEVAPRPAAAPTLVPAVAAPAPAPAQAAVAPAPAPAASAPAGGTGAPTPTPEPVAAGSNGAANGNGTAKRPWFRRLFSGQRGR